MQTVLPDFLSSPPLQQPVSSSCSCSTSVGSFSNFAISSLSLSLQSSPECPLGGGCRGETGDAVSGGGRKHTRSDDIFLLALSLSPSLLDFFSHTRRGQDRCPSVFPSDRICWRPYVRFRTSIWKRTLEDTSSFYIVSFYCSQARKCPMSASPLLLRILTPPSVVNCCLRPSVSSPCLPLLCIRERRRRTFGERQEDVRTENKQRC